MKKMKKILAFVMAMAMVLGMSVTSFAATKANGESDFGKEGDKGSITITGIKQEDGISIALYPVVEAKYDPATNVFAGYEVVKASDGTDLYKFKKGTDDDDDEYVIDAETLDAIGNTAQTSGTPLSGVEWVYDNDEEGYKTKTDSVPVGMYLVLITGAEAKIYNYAVASLYYNVEDGANTIEEGKLDLANAQIAAKVSDHPEVKKTAKDKDEEVVPSANIGDTIYYTLEVAPVPYYGGEHPVFNLVDTLSTGLTFQNDIVVKVEGEENALIEDVDYTVLTPADEAELEADKKTLEAGQIKIDFVIDAKYTLNDYAGKKVTVTYSAVLNENAAMNNVGNTNGVVLNYTKDSKVNEGVDDKTEEKKTYTYTFDIDGSVDGKESVTEGILTKIGEEWSEETQSKALKDAVFTLYTKNPDDLSEGEKAENFVYKNYKVAEDGSKEELFKGTTKSDEKGQLPVHGLAEGTYYLKETAAPDGYTLNTHVYVIKIEGTYEYMGENDENRGQLLSWTITIDGQTTNTFTVDQGTVTINKGVKVEGESVEDNVIGIDIPNTKISSLPSTGGIGTTIFTVGGCLIMIVAAGLFFASRRKSEK